MTTSLPASLTTTPAAQAAPVADLEAEFDRQVAVLVAAGYPELAGMDTPAFARLVVGLRDRVAAIEPGAQADLPFVVVVRADLVPPSEAMARVADRGRTGFTRMAADELARYRPIDGLALPGSPAWLAVGIRTGADTLNVTPDAALPAILAEGRSPLTIEEAVAVVTQRPSILRERNAFSILGSRSGDRRVTALWTGEGRPRLGWCWAGNPHSWLGSASCSSRLAPR